MGIERKQAEFISPEDESDVGKGGASHRHTTGSNTDRFFLQWQEFCLRGNKNIRHFGCLNSFMPKIQIGTFTWSLGPRITPVGS